MAEQKLPKLTTRVRFPSPAPTLRIGAIALLLLSSTVAMPQSPPLLPIVENGKWGFMDPSGKVAIAPRLPDHSAFQDGLARGEEDGKTIFIDPAGTVVLRPAFDIVRDFSEGLAAVNIGEHRYPVIGVIEKTGRWGYIDKAGKLALAMRFTQADSFSEGLAAVHLGQQGGFIDHRGKMVFEAPFDVSWGFHEGIVLVKSQLKMIYLDRGGRRLSTPPLDDNSSGGSFSEGLAAVEINGLWGYIDKAGKLVIPAIFRQAAAFHEGLAAAQPAQDGPRQSCDAPDGSRYSFVQSYGYIDRSGRFVIPPGDEYAGDFSEGLAAVSICRHARFIDHSGRTVITIAYDDAEVTPFSHGLAEVSFVDHGAMRRGYIDRQGKIVRAPTN